MKVLITGGTGFIGSRLALRCLAEGHSVLVLGQENTWAENWRRAELEEAGVTVRLGSVARAESWSDLMSGVHTVYHLAAAQHEVGVPDSHFVRVNVDGTRNGVRAAERHNVQRFVYGSTIGVYGALLGPVDEDSPCRPDNIYGRTKLEGERISLAAADRLPVLAVRIPETYGPGDFRLLKLFRSVAAGRFPIIGSGMNLHHPIYVHDLVDGLLACAKVSNANGEVLLLPGAEILSSREMATRVAHVLGVKPPRLRLPVLPLLLLSIVIERGLKPFGIDPPLHRRRLDFFRKSFQISSEKAERLIGFAARTDFNTGVRATALWYEEAGFL